MKSARTHCLTGNLPFYSSRISFPTTLFLSLLQDLNFVHLLWSRRRTGGILIRKRKISREVNRELSVAFNGGEFINEVVIAYCEQEQMTFTRGRPSLKNDQCFVEQKNGAIIRQVVGYDRFVGEQAYRQLTELYRALRLYVNCFQPSMKMQAKQRDGKKVCYVYDPAKTPLQRLLLSGVLPAPKQQELIEVAHALDPIRLFQQLEQLQQAVFRCATNCPPFVSHIPSAPIRVFSVEDCTA